MFQSIVSEKSIVVQQFSIKKASIVDKRTTKLKKSTLFFIMLSMNFIWAPTMSFYDFPQIFADPLITYFNISTVQISMLYTLPSLLTIIMCLFTGRFLNFAGLGLSSVIFNGLIFFGISLCFIGVRTKNFLFVIIGRTVASAVIESLCVAQYAIAEKWFSGRFLSISAGISRFLSSLFMFMAAYFQPAIYIQYGSMEINLFIYAGMAAVSFFSAVAYFLMERKHEAKLRLDTLDEEGESYMDYVFKIGDFGKLSTLAKMMSVLLCLVCSSYYMFTNFGTDFIMNVIDVDYSTAKDIISILPLMGMVLTPMFSILTNIIGKKSIMLFLCSLLVTSSYLCWQFIPEHSTTAAYLPIGLLGLYYGLYNALIWMMLALSLPRQAVGTVFGFVTSFTNIVFTAVPALFGYIVRDRTRAAYLRLDWVTFGMGCATMLLSFLAMIVDLKNGKLLHLPENDQRVADMREEMSKDLVRKVMKAKSEYKSLGAKTRDLNDLEDLAK
jgi:MFS family permease